MNSSSIFQLSIIRKSLLVLMMTGGFTSVVATANEVRIPENAVTKTTVVVDTNKRAPELDPSLYTCSPVAQLGIVSSDQYKLLVAAAEECFFRVMAAGEVFGPKSWVESLDQDEFNIDEELMAQDKKFVATGHNYERTSEHIQKLIHITNRAISTVTSYESFALFWPEGVSSEDEAYENPEYMVAKEKIDAILGEMKRNLKVAQSAIQEVNSLEAAIRENESNIKTLEQE